MSKVSIIGAGFVGSTVAHWAMIAGGCQIVLVDVVDGLAKGKVLDLIQAGPIAGHAIDAVGTTDYADTANSDIVIITAGVAAQAGHDARGPGGNQRRHRERRGQRGRPILARTASSS